MQDLQNYQYYDPAPVPTPEPWWRRRTVVKKLVGAVVLGVALVLVAVGVVNLLKNQQLAKEQRAQMDEVAQLSARLAAECDEGDVECIALAQARAARELGVVAACEGLEGKVKSNCVTLIARDSVDPSACDSLEGEDKQTCLDRTYLLQAKQQIQIAPCELISDAETIAACYAGVQDLAVRNGTCSEAGVEVSLCDAAVVLRTAIDSGDPEACKSLATETAQLDCQYEQEGQDRDEDGLSQIEEVELGLSDTNPDSDTDGLNDGDEVTVYETNPLDPDTDGDGFADGLEADAGYDPLN